MLNERNGDVSSGESVELAVRTLSQKLGEAADIDRARACVGLVLCVRRPAQPVDSVDGTAHAPTGTSSVALP
jgi:hypothetical protein